MPVRERELTRFDFNVFRFLHSEDTEMMTASEIGQFLLLLCDSWVLNRECSLPDDPKYLAHKARVRKVSPLVLSKFCKVPTQNGERLRNIPLYEQWQESLSRSESARELAGVRWGKAPRNADDGGARITNEEDAPVSRIAQYKTVHSSTEQNKSVVSSETTTETCESQNPDQVFRKARQIFRRFVGKNLKTLGSREREWEGIVKREGEVIVLAAVTIWARDNKEFLKGSQFPQIGHFLKSATHFIDDAKAARESAEETKNDSRVASGEDIEKAVGKDLVEVEILSGARAGKRARVHPDQAAMWFKSGYAKPLEVRAGA